ncbi:7-cyano-7-deazaguanine synthase QueC [Simplicispira suum]|uniref:7-cyano-7-deazaguanine synthase n=1 Tax=Simplicispira suum TaxID=2109915 RepID=A0A2S0MYS3_9BURK|nr:7-cyano-7-deazaguanine synthase QueC [Simplicispira suum]AVO41025.1 7-cyano-7-deazaguanine synthase QueC [Simplicispira suum]MBW7833485.1 7-cyano-7-deazaguanine synthase QueC [Simplicispira suum]
MRSGHALVLFSGGQDSTTCLAWALEHFAHVETVGFDYGQRHHVELQARVAVLAQMRERFAHWSERLGQDHMIDLAVLGQISDCALTQDKAIALGEAGLPNTFVPGRNLMFFQIAAALGYRRGLRTLVGGMCETDYSGYPDCRDDTLKALQAALSLGMGQSFTIETPLMWLDKAQTWELADTLGGQALIDIVVEHTHTCYEGIRSERHAWGYGCSTCPACALRRKGFERWSARDGQT